MIGLLNCMSRIIENVVTAKLLYHYKNLLTLNLRQMRTYKERQVINVVVILIHKD